MAQKADVFDPKWDTLANDEPRRAILARMRERHDSFAAIAHAAGLNSTYLGQYFKKPSPRFLPLPVARRLAEVLDLPVDRLYVEGPIPETNSTGAPQPSSLPVAVGRETPSSMRVLSHVVFPDGEIIEILTNRKVTTATVERLEAAVEMLKAGQE